MQDNIVRLDRDRDLEPDWREYLDGDDDEFGAEDPYDSWGVDPSYGQPTSHLGDLLEIVVIDDHVVDVRKRPVNGTAYERDAELLGRHRPVQPPRPPEPAQHEKTLAWLALLVGGEQSLAAMDAYPLPVEPLDLSDVGDGVRERLRRIDGAMTGVAEMLFESEVLTAARRVLRAAVLSRPGVLTASTSDERMACAVLATAAKASDLLGRGRGVSMSVLQELFGLRSAPTEKTHAIAGAVCRQNALVGGWQRPVLDVPILGSADYLVSSFRQELIVTRDAALALRAATPAAEESRQQ